MYKLFLLTTQVTSTWTIFSHEFPFFFTETSIFPHWTPIFLVLRYQNKSVKLKTKYSMLLTQKFI